MASTIDKVKNALHLNKDSTTDHSTTGHSTHSHGTHEGVAGPHGSKVANAADPRIDSDLDGSRNAGAAHNTHNTHGTSGVTGTHGVAGHDHTAAGTHNTGFGSHNNTAGGVTGAHNSNTTAGPHSSNLANKADPRVDSDRSNAYNTTGTGTGIGHNTHSATGTGAGIGHNTHSTTGNTFGNTGTTGGISSSTNAGPHDSNLANRADPRVDSTLTGAGNNHGAHHGVGATHAGTHATPGSGTAQNTAGPHNSDLLNKLDPRVDADLDGSKTVGGNKTHH